MRSAPAAKHVVEGLKDLRGVGLFEGKKLDCAAERVYADQDVAVAVSVRFTERDDVESVRGEGAAADGASSLKQLFSCWLDLLAN